MLDEDDDVRAYNQRAWDHQARSRDIWSTPVTPETIAAAREGTWSVLLTPNLPVPRGWFGASLEGVRLLGLASGGGQQVPTFAAAGANVTVFDASPEQIALDQLVADREGLAIQTELGDMADLSVFENESFDLVFHPVSNCFSPEVLDVWREVHRVLVPGGVLLAGFSNPIVFLIDPEIEEQRGEAWVRYSMPYADARALTDEELSRYTDKDEPIAYAHSLEDQIGGQLRVGLSITDLYEDYGRDYGAAIDKHLPCYIATRAVKR